MREGIEGKSRVMMPARKYHIKSDAASTQHQQTQANMQNGSGIKCEAASYQRNEARKQQPASIGTYKRNGERIGMFLEQKFEGVPDLE